MCVLAGWPPTLRGISTRRGWRWLILVASVLAQPTVALAHPGEPLQPHDLWRAWNLSPTLLLGLGGAAWLHARGAATLRRRGTWPAWRVAAFAGGWLALVAALVAPLDRLAGVLFSAHMAQHMLLVLAAAPLLALSAPLGPLLLGLPPEWRTELGRAWQQANWLRALWGWVSRPAIAWTLHAAAVWAWHTPWLYIAALENEGLHSLEHFTLLGTALLFWWVVLRPARRHAWLRGPGGTLFIFTQAMQSGLLGALITFSTQPWYPPYATTTILWGLTPVDDQQLAGALMWIPAGVVYLAGALGVLGAWLYAAERAGSALASPARLPSRELAVSAMAQGDD